MPKNQIPLKKWLADRKTQILIAVAGGATVTAAVMRYGMKQHNDFLKENNLYDEFYTVD